jgi:hypothetical protein
MLLGTAKGLQLSRKSAQSRSISLLRLETLQDLLDAICSCQPVPSNLVSMLRATAAHISMALGQPPDKIWIHQLLDIRPSLRRHLREKGFKRNSIRSYSNFLRILLAEARKLGWSECSPEIEHAWEHIRRATAKKLGCSRIIQYAVRNGLTPAQFTECHFADWRQAAIRGGRSAGTSPMSQAGSGRRFWKRGSRRHYRRSTFKRALLWPSRVKISGAFTR